MANTAYMYEDENGDLIFTSKLKGANPNHEKHPGIKCPNCGKLLFYVMNKDVKNDTLCFDIDTMDIKDFPRNYVRLCKKCHHHIGILFLNPKIRRILDIPLLHECHQKIKV